MFEMLYNIDKNLEVVKHDVKRINGTIQTHDVRIIKLEKGQSYINGKIAIISILFGTIGAVFISILLRLKEIIH